MPTFASYDFTAAVNNTSIHNDDTNWVRHPDSTLGAIVTVQAFGTGRQSNSTAVWYYYNAAPASADYSVFADIVAKSINATSRIAIVGRLSSTAITGYFLSFRQDSDEVQLWKVVAGTFTQLDSAPWTFTDEAVYAAELRLTGTSIRGFVDGVEVVSATDSAVTAAGFAGLRAYNVSTAGSDAQDLHFDNFEAVDPDGTPVSFSGTVDNQNGITGSAFSLDLSTYFSGSFTPFTYSLQAGSLAGSGLSLNTSTGVISGTGVAGTYSGLVVRATDSDSPANTADTNSFSITIGAATGGLRSVSVAFGLGF